MKNIRTFIFCSSLALTAWLAASYSAQLESSREQSSQEAQADQADQEGNASSPIAHIK